MTNHTKLLEETNPDLNLLRPLGWSDYFDRQLAAMGNPCGRVARIISARRGRFLVADGRDEWLCAPAGRLRHGQAHGYPVTGDWVLVDDIVVTAVLPRRTLLSRGRAGSRTTQSQAAQGVQPIAANLDTVFIVCGLDRDYNLRRLERYLALVRNCGLEPVIVLTKADLHEDTTPFQWEVESVAFGVPVVPASMHDGRGLDELASYLGQGRTVAMVGSSGAGKSTLANRLHGSEVQSTASVSVSVGKGRHTTTVRELIRMPRGGLLMDNPGIREIAFHESGEGVDSAFADIGALAEQCRFADCTHLHEPGCAVLRAVESGGLEAGRLESYRKMQREMHYLAERGVKSADRIEKERWQDIAQQIKGLKKRKPKLR